MPYNHYKRGGPKIRHTRPGVLRPETKTPRSGALRG